MNSKGNFVVWIAVYGVVAAIVVTALFVAGKPIAIRGAVIEQDSDSQRQAPIANVDVSAADGLGVADATTDFSGFFRVTLIPGVKPGRPLKLVFRHPEYQPLELDAVAGDRLYVARMTPLHRETRDDERQNASGPAVTVSNLIVRYSKEVSTTETVATVAKTFQAVNVGGVPCNGAGPCSPDGKWKAAIGEISLDAGESSEFLNPRFSCIAGPCPFTKIESDHFSRPGRVISVSALDWSDTATFLLEADVVRRGIADNIETVYPVVLGQGVDFTLPPGAEGPSIEAELDGNAIVFPLGPSAAFSWAECQVKTDRDQSTIYRCTLRAGYRLQPSLPASQD